MPATHVIVNLDAHFENVLLTFSKTKSMNALSAVLYLREKER